MASYNNQSHKRKPYEIGKLGKYDRLLLERDRLSTVGLNNLLHLPIRVAAFFDDRKYLASKKAANIVLNDIFRLSKKADLIGEGQKIIKCSKNGSPKRDLDRMKLRIMKIGSADSDQIRIKDPNTGTDRFFQRLTLAEVLSDPETFGLIVDLASHIFITRFGNEKAIKRYIKSSGKSSKKLEKDYKELISSIRKRHDIPKPINGGKAIGLVKYTNRDYEENYFSDELATYRPLGFDDDDVAGTVFEDYPERVPRSSRDSGGLYDAVTDFYGEPTIDSRRVYQDDDDDYHEDLGEKISEMGDAIKQLTHALQYSVNVKDHVAAPPVFEKGGAEQQGFDRISKSIMRSLKAHDKAIGSIARYLQDVITPALAQQESDDDDDEEDGEDHLTVEDFKSMMYSSGDTPSTEPVENAQVLVSREEFHAKRETIKDGGSPDLRRPEAVTYVDPDNNPVDPEQGTDS